MIAWQYFFIKNTQKPVIFLKQEQVHIITWSIIIKIKLHRIKTPGEKGMQDKDQPDNTEVSSVLSIQQLEVLFSDLRKRSFGMPLNQNKIDLTELGLSGLASHTISNLGDPYKEGCYKIQSKA